MNLKTKYAFFLLGYFMIISPVNAFYGTVTKVINGFTLVINSETYKGYVTIKLKDIEVSNEKENFNDQASSMLFQYAIGKNCEIVHRGYGDSYILFGDVICDGIDLRIVLLEKGYAWLPRFFVKDKDLINSQNIAQKAGNGVWKNRNEIERKRAIQIEVEENMRIAREKQARQEEEERDAKEMQAWERKEARIYREMQARLEAQRQKDASYNAEENKLPDSSLDYDGGVKSRTRTKSEACYKAEEKLNIAAANYDALPDYKKTKIVQKALALISMTKNKECGYYGEVKSRTRTKSDTSMTKNDMARQLGAAAGIMGSCGPEYDDALKRVSFLAGKNSLDKNVFDANLLSTITTKYSASSCREVRDAINTR